MRYLRRFSVPFLVLIAAAVPAAAQEAGSYVCTNMMGGNPFALIIGEGHYRVQSRPQSFTQIAGEGTLIDDPNRSYLMVGSGPLHDEWQIENIYGMQSGTLTLSGAKGLMDCKKKSKS